MKHIVKSLLLLIFVALSACAESENISQDSGIALDVFKTPTCGCCGLWISHLEESGFNITARNQTSLRDIKSKLHIPINMQSCHTAVSADNFFFEGHIPAKFIAQFLENPPHDAAGLAVPGMPMGSPGMEMGGHFSPYKIMLLRKDGSTEVYAEVNSIEEQNE